MNQKSKNIVELKLYISHWNHLFLLFWKPDFFSILCPKFLLLLVPLFAYISIIIITFVFKLHSSIGKSLDFLFWNAPSSSSGFNTQKEIESLQELWMANDVKCTRIIIMKNCVPIFFQWKKRCKPFRITDLCKKFNYVHVIFYV